MRSPVNIARRPQPKAATKALQAPIGGWDAKNALADMPPQNAVILDNWFPSTSSVKLRKGYSAHCAGMTSTVETLMTYTGLTGAQKLFAAAGSRIFDVTAADASLSNGDAVVTSLTNARFQQVNMGTSGGQFLFICNGADTPRTWDGAAWANSGITGPTIASLIWCNLHQTRLWVGEKESLTAYYGAANAISGAFTAFTLKGVAKLGGYLMGMVTWTRDSGTGMDDVAVFVTSEGEAIVYEGTDPASATTWGLIGVFRIGKPVGRRFFCKAGADALLITEDGYVPLSQVLSIDRVQADLVSLSDQINKAVNDAFVSYGTTYGWEPFVYPQGTMVIFNVPNADTTTVAVQHVFNAITKAPCRFTGIPATTWGLLGGNPYFGGPAGAVYRFDSGADDAGNAIRADALQAFNTFGTQGSKLFTMAEVVFESAAELSYQQSLNLDYDTAAPTFAAVSLPAGAELVWDTGKWDVNVWGGSISVKRAWRSVRGMGRTAALRIQVQDSNAEGASWIGTNFVMQAGGFLS